MENWQMPIPGIYLQTFPTDNDVKPTKAKANNNP
jgi:hypothetical protein